MNCIFNEETHSYEIQKYSEALQECKKFIDEQANLNLIILNDEDKKIVKKARTLVRKKLDEVSKSRKEINEIVLGNFNNQAKEIESELKKADGILKDKIDTYDNSQGKAKIITLTIKSDDENKIKQIKDLAIKLNMEVK